MQGVEVVEVGLETVLPIRRSVLRAGIPDPEVVFEGDDHRRATHFGAVVGEETVGVASLVPRSRPDGDPGGWQIRSVAVLPEYQGRGIASSLVRACIEQAHDASEIWLQARAHLVGFYATFGFAPVGDVYDKPPAGPHRDMTRSSRPGRREQPSSREPENRLIG